MNKEIFEKLYYEAIATPKLRHKAQTEYIGIKCREIPFCDTSARTQTTDEVTRGEWSTVLTPSLISVTSKYERYRQISTGVTHEVADVELSYLQAIVTR